MHHESSTECYEVNATYWSKRSKSDANGPKKWLLRHEHTIRMQWPKAELNRWLNSEHDRMNISVREGW
jgi:hypothetical protein